MELSNDVIIENIRASLAFESDPDRQMPDPLGNADIRWLEKHPPKAHELSALIQRQGVVNPAGVHWGARKNDRSQRDMILHNPYAELEMRLALASAAEQIVKQQTDLTIAGHVELRSRTKNSTPVLTTRSQAKSHAEYRRLRDDIIRRNPPVALKTDIQAFYPSVTPRQAERSVHKIASIATATTVRLMLEKHAIDTGVAGLPVGPETSAWVANMILAPADHVLARFVGVEALRWSDDLHLVDGVRSLVEECFTGWTQAIGECGLAVSLKKTQKSWEIGISGGDLLVKGPQSQGDISAAIGTGSWQWVSGELFDELRTKEPDRARLNRLFGTLAKEPSINPAFVRHIVELMLEDPETWECNVPRARSFLAIFADPTQREQMIGIATDLCLDGLAASEQVVALCWALTASTDASREIAEYKRFHAVRQLVNLARADACVPIRGWARMSAHKLDAHKIARQTIDTGEFADLHPFEQRWAIAFADRRRHHWWLEKQAESGRWPITAQWRLNTR